MHNTCDQSLKIAQFLPISIFTTPIAATYDAVFTIIKWGLCVYDI